MMSLFTMGISHVCNTFLVLLISGVFVLCLWLKHLFQQQGFKVIFLKSNFSTNVAVYFNSDQ
jgi:hypothetical protein